MQQIRRNTKKYKNIQKVLLALAARHDRQAYVKIYFVEPGKSLNHKIDLEKMGESGDLYYDMNYNNILSGLENNNLTLYEEEDNPGLFFFRDRSHPQWDQIPFRLPMHAIDTPDNFLKSLPPAPAKKPPSSSSSKPIQNVTDKNPHKEPDQPPPPLFQLKQRIEFTGLEEKILKQPTVTKKDLLQYYFDNQEAILPFLNNRPLMVKRKCEDQPVICSLENFNKLAEYKWLQTIKTDQGPDPANTTYILCPDIEHLLLLVEHEVVAFYPHICDFSTPEQPDMTSMVIHHSNEDLHLGVFHTCTAILEGLSLPFFVFNDLHSVQILIPLNSKSKAEEAFQLTALIRQLVLQKENYTRSQSLDQVLTIHDQFFTAPFSFLNDPSCQIALPEQNLVEAHKKEIDWQVIHKLIQKHKNLPQQISKKAIHAGDELQRLIENYGFLI